MDQMPCSQKCSLNSDWNSRSNLLKVFGISLKMSSDPKKYFGSTFDELTEFRFMLSVRISSYGCTWEVWRALKEARAARGAAESNSSFFFNLA